MSMNSRQSQEYEHIVKWRNYCMLHKGSIVCTALMLMVGVAGTAVAASPQPGGIEALLELLQNKGVITGEESKAFSDKGGSASRTDLKGVIDLLRAKGTISNDEAAAFLQRLAAQPRLEAEKSADITPAVPEPDEKAAVPIPNDELKPSLEVLREQGVLGADEVAQIVERIGTKWSPADEEEPLALIDNEIEFSRTTLPREGLLNDIVQLRRQGLIARDEAERIRKRFLQKLSLERVTADIGEEARREIRNQVEARVPTLPEWTQRIKFSGDLRLRYQADLFDGFNVLFVKPDNTTTLLNTSQDRHRYRIRARFGLTAKVNDAVEAGISLATGNTTDPVSTNQTLGDSLNRKSILLDTAYMRWTPTPSLALWGGRFPSPWYSTDLVWDQDLNFDGVAFSYKPQLTPRTSLFMTAGAFPIQEVELSSKDKWLFGGQLGVQYRNDQTLTARLAAAFYDFEHTTGEANDPERPNQKDYTAPQFQQKGNSLFDIDPTSAIKTAYASEFRELNVTGSLDLGFWDPVRVVLSADYVNNIGFDKADVDALTGSDVKRETEGYQFGITVGHPDTREFGTWNTYLFYKHLERDAVMDAFTDSDFNLGGTNAKGWITGADFGVAKNSWLSARWLTTNEISGPPLGIDVFQFNVNARF